MKDYYETLGVESGASQQKLKDAYRKLAFQYHPDRSRGNPAALERMKEINEAYAVLSDPGKRSDYDGLRQQYGSSGYERFKQNYSDQDIFRGSDIHQVFEEMARSFGFRSFEEVFKESYGPGYRTFEFRRPGVFGRGFIFSGSSHGRGDHRGAQEGPGILTGGTGRLTRYLLKKMLGIGSPARGKDWHDVIYLRAEDALQGGKLRYLHRRRSKELMITVPPGVREGQKIKLRGMGEEGRDGAEPGDLYLKVRIPRSLLQRLRDFLLPRRRR